MHPCRTASADNRPPHSHNTFMTPLLARYSMPNRGSNVSNSSTSTPRPRRFATLACFRGSSFRCARSTVSPRATSKIREFSFRSKDLLITTLRGRRAPKAFASSRTFRVGLSRRTVFPPMMIASDFERRSWTHSREEVLDIQRELPESVAIFPSRVMAYFHVPYGRPNSLTRQNPSFSFRHSNSSSLMSTRIPCRRRKAIPSPLVRGSGSTMPTTTRATATFWRAIEQGGVRP
mmetsp:Transcript_3824/g.7315  ORF Transcript_3824/g.7315 Transcript_3824/m.7315 type:complete len:233 (-) Transcript_3824:240-938(-)